MNFNRLYFDGSRKFIVEKNYFERIRPFLVLLLNELDVETATFV